MNTGTQQAPRLVNVIHRTDTREVRKRNPTWPEYKDVDVGLCEVRGSWRAVWQNGELIGYLTSAPDLVGFRVAT